MTDSRTEIEQGRRFAFGTNWRDFVELVGPGRIDDAKASLLVAVGEDGLAGKRFLDAGCGSGLFSLAAREMAAQVVSFDFDADSVAATSELRERFRPDDEAWTVLRGSVLDEHLLGSLGLFDVVYGWGVLHHTGDMWRALDLCSERANAGGLLVFSIYNDQGWKSRIWRSIKRRYNTSGPIVRRLLIAGSAAWLAKTWPIGVAASVRDRGKRSLSLTGVPNSSHRPRGMSRKHDLVDWVGGYPFEVAKPEEVFDFLRERGFELHQLTTCGGGIGCNQFVFRRRPRVPGE